MTMQATTTDLDKTRTQLGDLERVNKEATRRVAELEEIEKQWIGRHFELQCQAAKLELRPTMEEHTEILRERDMLHERLDRNPSMEVYSGLVDERDALQAQLLLMP